MSCFILNNESAAALASLLDRVANSAHWSGRVRYGVYCGNSLHFLLSREWTEITGRTCVDLDNRKIYTILRRMNEKAYGERYHRIAAEVAAGMPTGDCLHTVDSKPWQMLKTFECFLYQCDEGTVGKSELFAALTLAKNHYMKHLVKKLPDYDAATWG